LPGAVRELVEQGSLPPHTAYEVSKLDDPADQVELAEWAVRDRLSADQAAEAVKSRKLGIRAPAESPRPRPVQVEVRPGVVVTVKGVTGEAEAAEACKAAASLLRRRGRDRAA
jgi:ParB family chromosome partitioning protein